MMTGNQIQKFFKHAGAQNSPLGFQVTLDGRPIHTPERQVLVLPTQALALAVAAEWEQQDKFLNSHSMPLMQMTTRAVDMPITCLREQLQDRIVSFLSSDTICFRETTQELQEKQEAKLTPLIRHLKTKYGLELPIVTGVTLPELPESTVSRLREYCESLDCFDLVALETAASVSKSAGLALALQDGFIDILEGLKLSRLEEDFQHLLSGKVHSHDIDEAQELMMLSAARALSVLKRVTV